MKKSRNPKLDTDIDYIECRKYKNSLRLFLEHHPDGVSFTVIARLLQLPISEVENIYNSAILKLKESLRSDEEI
jgi:hypothetical protein